MSSRSVRSSRIPGCSGGDLRLGPDLADLCPLPESVTLSLNRTLPFGGPDSEPEDDCTEEELDRMVAVLGPLVPTTSLHCPL